MYYNILICKRFYILIVYVILYKLKKKKKKQVKILNSLGVNR